MDRFQYIVPTKEWKQKAIDYINEFYQYHSNINGTGGLQRYLDNYDEWLKKLEEDYVRKPNEEKVPAKTYFLVREADEKIVGMINIRLSLNEKLKKSGGHIGYSIRPTERRRGYNKINLYLGLKVCQECGIDEVLMDADKDNPASWRTMEAMGGKLIREYLDSENSNSMIKKYRINVSKALKLNKNRYEHLIANNSTIKNDRRNKL